MLEEQQKKNDFKQPESLEKQVEVFLVIHQFIFM